MESNQKITVLFDKNLVDHHFLSYMPENRRLELAERLQQKTSVVCGFMRGNDIIFCAAFDFEFNCVHVREVGGFFGRYCKLLDTFVQGFAKATNCGVVTFNSESKAVAKWAEKLGYHPTHEKSEYLKRIE